MEAYRVVRYRGSYIFNTISFEMAVRFLVRWPRFISQEDSWHLFLLEAEPIPRPKSGWKD
jgi:hypothetical protein